MSFDSLPSDIYLLQILTLYIYIYIYIYMCVCVCVCVCTVHIHNSSSVHFVPMKKSSVIVFPAES